MVSSMISIILITNKMKIITHLQLVGRLLYTKPSHLFSNLFKDAPLHFQDLMSRTSGTVQQSTGKTFNINNKRFNSPISTAIPTAHEAATRKLQALEFMEKTISKIGPQKEVRTSFEIQGLSQEERKDNTALLMKYIDHILERPLALEVIKMVEKYCHMRRPSDKEMSTVLMMGKYTHEQKDESNLFKNLYDYLFHSLNFYSENIQINSQLIDSLLELLATSDPFMITTDSYMHGSFSIEDEEVRAEVQGQAMFESAAGGKYFQEVNEQDKEGKEGNKYKAALEEAFRLKDKTKFSKLYLRKTAEVEDGKTKEQKLRVASQKVYFHKKINKLIKSTGPKQQDLRSAYIYELPFTITETQAEEFIHFLQSSRGIKVESYALFPYKNFIEKQHLDIVFRVPERYTDKNVHMQRIVKTVDIDELTTPTAKKGKRTKKSEFDSVPLENEPHRRKSVTEALLLKIKKESYSKFNKSSMLIKFASRQDKEAVLTPESRLYGVNYKHFRNIKFQQGFCKTSVSLIGIPWGCSSKQLQKHLNQALQPDRLSIKVQQNCILTKSSIVIQFQYLSQAILAIQKINNLTFQNKQLRAHLSYGSCKVNNSQYNMNIDQSYDKLKLKIEQSGAYYSRKYEDEETQSSQ